MLKKKFSGYISRKEILGVLYFKFVKIFKFPTVFEKTQEMYDSIYEKLVIF